MSSDTLYIKRLRPFTTLVTASKVRPADTATYAAGDVINESASAGSGWVFDNVAREAGRGAILQSALLIQSVAQSLKLDADLFLFDAAPAAQNDNLAWAPSDAEIKNCVAVVRFFGGTFVGSASNGVLMAEGIAKPLQCAPASASLFGVLVARNAYVPTSAEEITIKLAVVQD
jgi:hypothetical protein